MMAVPKTIGETRVSFTEVSRDQVRDIIYQIRRLIQANDLHTKELTRKYQVSSPQLNCLMALYEQGPLPPSQIAKAVFLKSSTVTGIIDRLELKGFVSRVRRSSDRRVITIELTEPGRMLAEKAPPPLPQKIIEGLARLSQEDVQKVVDGLKMLTCMLDVQALDLE
jgi:DNA-binding MarR family transcriptional regulator